MTTKARLRASCWTFNRSSSLCEATRTEKVRDLCPVVFCVFLIGWLFPALDIMLLVRLVIGPFDFLLLFWLASYWKCTSFAGQLRIKYPDITGEFLIVHLTKGNTGLGKWSPKWQSLERTKVTLSTTSQIMIGQRRNSFVRKRKAFNGKFFILSSYSIVGTRCQCSCRVRFCFPLVFVFHSVGAKW